MGNVISSVFYGDGNGMIFRQFFDSLTSTYTYLLADSETKEGILIDSTIDNIERDTKYIKELGVKIKYLAETHVHADHVSAVMTLIRVYPDAKIVYGVKSGVDQEVISKLLLVKEGDKIEFGKYILQIFETSGHTNGCISYYLNGKAHLERDMVFTGDAMMIRACGRTDFQQGNPGELWDNTKKLYKNLSDDCIVYPGHDYHGVISSTIGEEKKFTKRCTDSISRDDFISMMKGLKLDLPRLLHFSVPANFLGGITVATKIYDKVYTNGYVSELSIEYMKKKRIDNFIFLTSNQDLVQRMKKKCEEVGMKFIHLQYNYANLCNGKLGTYCEIMDKNPGNTVISCKTENFSRFFALYYLKKKGVKNGNEEGQVNYDEVAKFIKAEAFKKYLKTDLTDTIQNFLKKYPPPAKGAKNKIECGE